MIATLLASVALLAAAMSHGMVKPVFTHGALPSLPAPAGENAGKKLYEAHCAYCHGEQLQGSPGPPPDGRPIPPLIGVGPAAVDFMLTTGRMPLEVPGTEPIHMQPSFPPDQIAAIVAYVTAHGGGRTPAVPTVHENADLTRGRALFEVNCQQCHGATAVGNVAGFGWIAPSLQGDSPVQIAEAVRTGPGVMPRFDEHQLPQRDLDALVSYVTQTLQHPDNKGGWDIGSTGPVGEGLVAWLLGLGGIVFVMRRIGEKLK